MIFDVIDLKTEKYPDFEDIVSNEKWASGLDGYEMEGFFIGEDGSLCLADEFGNYVFCPHDRFKIIILIDDQKYSFIY